MTRLTDSDRYTLLTTADASSLASFADEVESGLRADPKRLPCRFLYDHEGSLLFEQICDLPEYYPTRTERSILLERADELAGRFDEPISLIELGSGSASKTRLLIEAFLRRHRGLTFVPIDISRSVLERSAVSLLKEYAPLEIQAIEGEYEPGLRRRPRDLDQPQLILWLGSSIGNLDRAEAADFLASIRSHLGPRDELLVGIDLRKEASRLEAAYDDALGVTARFNLNLLARINRELGGNFELEHFRHRAYYSEEHGRVEMHLDSRRAQRVRIEHLDLEAGFTAGESIHTENAYKYSLDQIDELAGKAGLRSEARWLDADELFSLNLFTAT
ncbi:MAG: L-histidine N(alpha)-methyltransferase [Myxococcota bacterium]